MEQGTRERERHVARKGMLRSREMGKDAGKEREIGMLEIGSRKQCSEGRKGMRESGKKKDHH